MTPSCVRQEGVERHTLSSAINIVIILILSYESYP